MLDLDSKDGLVLVIENKLFGTNSTGQLRDQLLGVEDKYSRATIREYVYLTLVGEKPSSILPAEAPLLNRWVALGWLTQVLDILDRLEPDPRGRLKELVVLLRWLKELEGQAKAESETVRLLIETILTGTVDCTLFELNRLCGHGEWKRKTTASHKHRLVHSSAPSRHLSLKLLTNCSITLQSKKSGRPQCDKLLLPFGAPSRQVFNLLHITARDLYWIHFGKPMAFLKNTVRKKHLNETEKSFAPMLDFIARHRFELQALLGVSRCGGNSLGLAPIQAPIQE